MPQPSWASLLIRILGNFTSNYPKDSINYLVAQRLSKLAEKQRSFARPPVTEDGETA